MAVMNYSTIFASAGFAGESFDICQGPANTGVIDVLLSVGNGQLQEGTPHVLISTGALGAARILTLDAMEVETIANGGQALNGRFFYLSVQNSDITSNSLTVSGSTSINGQPTFVIDNAGDFIFHFVSAGVWRVNSLPTPGQEAAVFRRIPFFTTDWVNNQITCIAAGPTPTPGTGEVGPHNMTIHDGYLVQILNQSLTPHEYVDVEIHQAVNGDITIVKAPLAPAFDGTFLLSGSLDGI